MRHYRILWAILIGITVCSLLNLIIDIPFSAVFSMMAILSGLTLMFALFINTYRIEPNIKVKGIDFIKDWVISVISITAGFASIYLDLARQSLSHFAGAIDGISAMYFSVNTFATVGFGDIYPISALARLLVMSEILVAVIVLPLTIGTSLAWIIKHKIKQQSISPIYDVGEGKQRRLSRIK